MVLVHLFGIFNSGGREVGMVQDNEEVLILDARSSIGNNWHAMEVGGGDYKFFVHLQTPLDIPCGDLLIIPTSLLKANQLVMKCVSGGASIN